MFFDLQKFSNIKEMKNLTKQPGDDYYGRFTI